MVLGGTDEEVARALERMRLNFYQLWIVVEELRASSDPDGLLREWRAAPKWSIGWRKALLPSEAELAAQNDRLLAEGFTGS